MSSEIWHVFNWYFRTSYLAAQRNISNCLGMFIPSRACLPASSLRCAHVVMIHSCRLPADERTWQASLRSTSFQVFEDVASSLEDTLFPVREDGRDRRACPNCEDGRLYLNGSAKGAFVACSNYRLKGDKQCTYIRTFSGDEYTGEGAEGVEVGMHPEHKAMIYVKEGRHGRYVFTACVR